MNQVIFYTSIFNADDLDQWSGLGFYIKQMLLDQGYIVEPIYPLEYRPDLYVKIKNRLNKNWIYPRELSVVKNYAKQIEQRVANRSGILFSPGTLPVAFYEGDNPVVIYTDATFASICDYYDEFKTWSDNAIRAATTIEKAALERADLLLYSSDWAAKSAIKEYGINPYKVRVVPFGANISEKPTYDQIEKNIQSKLNNSLELLFIGVDWERKGGERVVNIFNYIKNKGIEVTLNIAGPRVNPFKESPKGVNYYGFLNKKSSEDRKLLQNLFSSAHFFIMLSSSECFGLVYVEANAYGTPALGFNTGGVPTVISNANGYLVPSTSSVEEIGDTIIHLFQNDREKYLELCKSSFEMFDQIFNWDQVGKTIKNHLDHLLI